MSSNPESRPESKNPNRRGGFNPMKGGYSGNANSIARDSNGVSAEGGTPYPPRPPKGGTGESAKPMPPPKQLIHITLTLI